MERGGLHFLVGSIYGPNRNETEFFDKINNLLSEHSNLPVILGGDFNATWDCRDVADNLDILNMVSPPSKYRSEKINWIARNNALTDPYRYLYPNRRDFTYIPNARQNLNRSRIDFFLISTALCGRNLSCNIEQTLSTRAFDHKKIELNFTTGKKQIKSNAVKNQMLTDPVFVAKVRTSVFECHLQHADPDIFPPYLKRELLETLGLIHNKINTVHELSMGNSPDDPNILNQKKEIIQEIEALMETLPETDFFENIEKSCDADVFLRY
jgi:hypothetical protein